VKVYRGRVGTFDFEDLMWGWPVQDIATTFYYFYGEARFDELLEAFKRGYTSLREWPERVPGEITTFIAGRALVLANDLLIDTSSPEWQAAIPRYFERTEARLRALLEGGTFNADDYPIFE